MDNRKEIQEAIKKIQERDLNYKETKQFLKEEGFKIQYKSIAGHKVGNTTGLPESEGYYSTVANGTGENFLASTLKPGETFDIGPFQYVVVWNKYIPGNPHIFAWTGMILVLLTKSS